MTFMVVNIILLSSFSFLFELGINKSFFSRIDGWPPEADRGLFFKLTSDVSIRVNIGTASRGFLYVPFLS